ncbi:M23 family metallopeptidase [Zhihengliuella flava]|uniref:Murein DD-endopeptidase MepM/ murein hydrolase activator NlpD n=1 Tax=Zhihengliuella flava TaxID=1285193 RepID=A0A931DAC8_9MICC|nr:M23 family metallopeptidase [Zhihengliuella flava]MBG6083866.1 murein DD-endopeptidase MepM/ murein hydrolase activator NlpD [Zhihengliuella flava]
MSHRTTSPHRVRRLVALLAALCLIPPAVASARPEAPPPSSTPPSSSWVSPLGGTERPEVLRAFDAPESDYGAGHRGVDLATDRGNVVLAPATGRVAFTGVVVDRPVISIDHPSGLRTSLEPVESTVAVGDVVHAGDAVGQVATGGHCAQDCVHWGVRRNGTYVNPLLSLTDTRPSVLLPLE